MKEKNLTKTATEEIREQKNELLITVIGSVIKSLLLGLLIQYILHPTMFQQPIASAEIAMVRVAVTANILSLIKYFIFSKDLKVKILKKYDSGDNLCRWKHDDLSDNLYELIFACFVHYIVCLIAMGLRVWYSICSWSYFSEGYFLTEVRKSLTLYAFLGIGIIWLGFVWKCIMEDELKPLYDELKTELKSRPKGYTYFAYYRKVICKYVKALWKIVCKYAKALWRIVCKYAKALWRNRKILLTKFCFAALICAVIVIGLIIFLTKLNLVLYAIML